MWNWSDHFFQLVILENRLILYLTFFSKCTFNEYKMLFEFRDKLSKRLSPSLPDMSRSQCPAHSLLTKTKPALSLLQLLLTRNVVCDLPLRRWQTKGNLIWSKSIGFQGLQKRINHAEHLSYSVNIKNDCLVGNNKPFSECHRLCAFPFLSLLCCFCFYYISVYW